MTLMTAMLPILNDVQTAIAAGSAEKRGALLRHVTDLFLVGSEDFSDEEIELFDDIFARLVAEIETSARALLALRLAPLRHAPPNIIRTLAFDDETDVACPVLAQSERLDDPALVENATTKGQEHLLAISRRCALSTPVTDVLVERGDAQVAACVAENRGARFSTAGMTRLVRRASSDDRLAICVGSRADIPPHIFEELLAQASAHVRARLAAEHPHATREVGRAVDEAADRIEAGHGAASPDISRAREQVEALHRSGQLDDEQIRSFAEDGLAEQIRVSLSILSGLPLPFVTLALRQESGETLVVLARANGLSWATVRTIMQSAADRRPSTPGALRHCLARFEKLGRDTAAQIVRFYQSRDGKSAH